LLVAQPALPRISGFLGGAVCIDFYSYLTGWEIIILQITIPSPLEILIDPISFGVITVYLCMIAVETIFPGRELSVVKGWKLRASVSFAAFFYLSSYLPLIWDNYLVKCQLFDLGELNIYLGLDIYSCLSVTHLCVA
jgi:hypothetical protein